jgi:putative ubiquitin-RnfH superfamily antitoxin RatB of RatAB toxin-antitoxin module
MAAREPRDGAGATMDEPANLNRALKVGIAYATAARQVWLEIEVAPGTTVQEAIFKSGILDQFPEIDLGTQKVGVFGKLTKLDAQVEEGDRIEIYRPITADPKAVKRKRDKPDADDAGDDDGGGDGA